MSILFITGNQTKHKAVAHVLAGLPIVPRKLPLPRAEGPIAEAVERRVQDAFRQVEAPCFTEVTRLELEGRPPMSGAAFKRRWLDEGPEAVCADLGGRHGRVRVAVAYTADGAAVSTFEGDSQGVFTAAPRGAGGYGWDTVWQPEGFDRTLAEMGANRAFVNMRYGPYLELRDLLQDRRHGGTFEAHVTVSAAADLERFRKLCDEMQIKAVWIELPEGASPSQPMTASYHHGEMRDVLEEVHAIARRFAESNLEVTRIKLEAVGKNRDIPETDAAAAAAADNYFEFHIKVLVPAGADRGPLAEVCAAHDAHLSRNARKVRDDGVAETFVTLRVFGLGRPNAEARFAGLLAAVRGLGMPLGQRIREYTVYDSNEGVDAGWASRR